MIEELVQILAGQLSPVRPSVTDALFHHWSAAFTWINLYRYISFPPAALAGEIIYLRYSRHAAAARLEAK